MTLSLASFRRKDAVHALAKHNVLAELRFANVQCLQS